jgi:hypothetical protein
VLLRLVSTQGPAIGKQSWRSLSVLRLRGIRVGDGMWSVVYEESGFPPTCRECFPHKDSSVLRSVCHPSSLRAKLSHEVACGRGQDRGCSRAYLHCLHSVSSCEPHSLPLCISAFCVSVSSPSPHQLAPPITFCSPQQPAIKSQSSKLLSSTLFPPLSFHVQFTLMC